MNQYVEAAETAARIGGEILLSWRGKVQAREKRPDDLVTQADFESQAAIRAFLLKAFPDHGFQGEEEDSLIPSPQSPTPAEYTWIVDPLDGTANFVHGLAGFAVSIGLVKDGEPIAGVVFDPVSGELFKAALGEGAILETKLNAKRLQVSRCQALSKAMICASLPPQLQRGSPEIARLNEVLLAARGVRRLGSAALNLAYIADGRLDGYWATSIYAWDVSAGILLVREAGGVITDLSGGPYRLDGAKIVATGSAPLHEQLLATLNRI